MEHPDAYTDAFEDLDGPLIVFSQIGASHPSQWVGMTPWREEVLVRYRFGRLEVYYADGFDDDSRVVAWWKLGGKYDGILSTDRMLEVTGLTVGIPCPHPDAPDEGLFQFGAHCKECEDSGYLEPKPVPKGAYLSELVLNPGGARYQVYQEHEELFERVRARILKEKLETLRAAGSSP